MYFKMAYPLLIKEQIKNNSATSVLLVLMSVYGFLLSINTINPGISSAGGLLAKTNFWVTGFISNLGIYLKDWHRKRHNCFNQLN